MLSQRFALVCAMLVASALTFTPQARAGNPPQITAVWRSGTHLDLFTTNSAGQVMSSWWEGGCGWQPWFLIHPEVKMQPGATVTALWRSNFTHLDLFVSGTDGAVWSTWWEAAPGWQPWFLVHAEVKMQPGAAIAALWRSNDTHLDLFATGTDGAVWSTWWEGKPGWQPWFTVHSEVKMQPGAAVMAVWRSNDTHLDLFAMGTDGAVWSTWWEATPGWQKWFIVDPQVKMQPGATVSAVWRSNDTHLDLFATGTDGAVWSNWWEAAPGWQKWFIVDPQVKMQPGATVSAIWRSNDTHLDLFATGTDGAVWSNWWEAAPGWQKWFTVHPEVKMKPGATVSALWRSNDTHLDLFSAATDGTVWSTWWEGQPGWQPWFNIYPDPVMQRLADQRNVLTNRHDNARTGAYLAETTLTPANVTSSAFGKLYQRQVQGQMLAQPLYVRGVNTKTQGVKNLIVVATAANMVYAFDADNLSSAPNAGLIASRKLHNSSPLSPAQHNSAVRVCPETYPPYIGVTSTPVIDPAQNIMYVVSFSSDDGKQYLHALDLTNDLSDTVPPVVIQPPASMTSDLGQGYQFATFQRNRPGLLLLNGVIYVAFASFICDNPVPYAGWVFGYSKGLQQLSVWRTPQNAGGGGIWQSGRGLVASPTGDIYFMTGNDIGNLARGKLGNSFVKLRSSCASDLTQEGVFEPANSLNLSNGDTDLGSSGPILVQNRVIGGGKQGRVYVLDSNTMALAQDTNMPDGFQGFQAFQNTYHPYAQMKMQPGATVTALWRSNQTHLDLFVTGNDGAVRSSWWEAAPGWQTWFLIHPEVKMRPGNTVTALWRSNDTHLDLFAIGTDGAVWSTWWEAGPGWQSWFTIHPEVKMQPGTTVTALWRSNDTHLDLFATGTNGAVWSSWWEAAPGWQKWFLIHPEVKMRAGATVTALWRSNDTHLDLFATGTDGAVWSTWWEGKPGWQPWFTIHPEVKMQPEATVSALWRSNETHLDLFATGTDGAVWSTWWEAAPGWQKWFTVHPEVKMRPGTPVSALWRSNDTHLDLFATGTDGAVWSTWWEAKPGWQPWFTVHPEVKMQPGDVVSAFWRSDDTHLDLFATGTDGAVWSTWWEGAPGWQKWFLVHPDVQACTNLPVNYTTCGNQECAPGSPGGVSHTRFTPDMGNPDKYCRDFNSIKPGTPGYNWTDVCTYVGSCYLPVSCYQFCQTYGPNIHAGFAYWQSSTTSGFLYGMSEKDYLRQFQFDVATQHVNENPTHVSQYRAPEGMPGGAVAISANSNQNGIVWLSMPSAEDATGGIHRGTFLAADALDLHELWRDDCILYFAKFNPPIIADGKVVLATFADPTGQAVPGEACNTPPPAVDWNIDYGKTGSSLNVGTAWVIVYGLKPQ